MRNKAVVIGYFGFKTNQIDGQTIKTRNVYQLLNTVYDVEFFDTESLKSNKVAALTLLWLTIKHKNVFYLGAHNNLRYFFPLLYLISKARRGKIVYVTVGGWLYDFLKTSHSFYTYMIKSIHSVLVETEFLKLNLRELGIVKTELIPNFRLTPAIKTITGDRKDNIFRIVFMARIVKEKGVFLLLDFFEAYLKNTDAFNKHITLDFYGPVSDKDAKSFYERVSHFDLDVNYKGVLDPSDIYKTLPDYDLLVLPTFYEGEGFPGTILDAYLCGLPVIATRWKQIPEFVEDNETGFLIDYDVKQLSVKIQKLANDDRLLSVMKNNAQQKSKKYSAETGLQILKKAMGF